MLRRLVVLLVILLSGSQFGVVFGGENPPLLVAPAGYWYVLVGPDGVPRLERVGEVIRVSVAGVEPLPQPPVVPPAADPIPRVPAPVPLALDALVVEQVRAATVRLSEFDDAQRLGLVYESMAAHLASGELSEANVFTAIVRATEAVLQSSGGAERWKPWRSEVSRLTTTLTREGKLATPELIGVYLSSVSSGLRSGVPSGHAKLPVSEGVAVLAACNALVETMQP